jgi:hypothetical protein
MALSAEQQQIIIRRQVGAFTDEELEELMPAFWDMHADNDNPFLRVKQEALRFLLGKERENIDTTTGPDSVKAKQRFDNVAAMLKEVTETLASEGTADANDNTLNSVMPKSSMSIAADTAVTL